MRNRFALFLLATLTGCGTAPRLAAPDRPIAAAPEAQAVAQVSSTAELETPGPGAKYQAAFDKLDADHDGLLTYTEIAAPIETGARKLTTAADKVASLLERLDAAINARPTAPVAAPPSDARALEPTIEPAGTPEAETVLVPRDDDARAGFDRLDADRDGAISFDEYTAGQERRYFAI